MSNSLSLKKKCRQYSVEYLKYGFIALPTNKQLPMCRLCEKTFSNEAMKPSRLYEHLEKIHPQHKEKDLSFFQTLHNKFSRKKTVINLFTEANRQNNDGLRASYNISRLIAKAGKPHTIGEELLLPAISEVLSTVLLKSPTEILSSIPLSRDSVRRRIDEMSESVETSLCMILRETKFSLQLDESTLPGNECLLLTYVRYRTNQQLMEELLFAKYFTTDTKGETIFCILQTYFE